MGRNKAKFKKTVKVKFALIVLLLIIMIPLIAGYSAVKSRLPEEPAESSETATDSGASEMTQAVTQEETSTEGETLTDASPSVTKSPDQALIITVTDEENWALAIISVEYKLPEGYIPSLSAAVEGHTVELDSRVAPYYREMYDAAKADGCILTPYSGYRSYSSQESIYTRKINYYKNQGLSEEEAVLKTQSIISPPGCSENNAGLAMDIVSASSDFVNTKEYQWLIDNAQEYGFILRYPEDKTDKTGVMYEPWHWRFVGVEAAKEMKNNGQCLEEYLGIK